LAKGAVSITDVLPGGGFLPAGSLVAVVGIGFQPGAQVLVDSVSLASTSWVDSSRIEVVTAVETQLDGRMVSVTNPDLTGATYFSYLRATDLGKSARPLLAATEAIFPVQTQSSALFAAPTTGTFFGRASPGGQDLPRSLGALSRRHSQRRKLFPADSHHPGPDAGTQRERDRWLGHAGPARARVSLSEIGRD